MFATEKQEMLFFQYKTVEKLNSNKYMGKGDVFHL